MKKIMFGIIIGMFLISLASADILLDEGKQGECLELKQTCSNCTFVNVTEVFRTGANATTWTINDEMTKVGVNYNYTFCDTYGLGKYQYTVIGDKNGVLKVEQGYFEITPSGFTDTLGFYILIFILSLGIVLLGYYAQEAVIVILGSFGLVFLGLYCLFNGITGIKDSVYTWAISLIVLGLAFYLLFRASQEFLD